jgi:hypothetical protein
MDEDKNNSIIRLTNPEFSFEFNGLPYTLRKASLDKAVLYQIKVKELANDPAGDLKLLAYCIWLMLKDKIADLTEELVMQNTPADVDVMQVLSVLGFINPSKMEQASKIKDALVKKLTGESSS